MNNDTDRIKSTNALHAIATEAIVGPFRGDDGAVTIVRTPANTVIARWVDHVWNGSREEWAAALVRAICATSPGKIAACRAALDEALAFLTSTEAPTARPLGTLSPVQELALDRDGVRAHALRFPPLALALACAAFGFARMARPLDTNEPVEDERAESAWEWASEPYEADFQTFLEAAGPQAEQIESLAKLRESAEMRATIARMVELVYGSGPCMAVQIFGEGWRDHGTVKLKEEELFR